MKRTRAFAALLMVLLAVLCTGLACADGGSTAIIDAGSSDRLHLRAQPSKNARSLGLYFTGTQVEVTGGAQGDFVPVRIGTEDGFMHADYLKTGEEAAAIVSEQPFGVATPKVGARLRSGPSLDSEAFDVIDQGGVFTVLGETGSHWYYVQYEGQNGYVSAEVANLLEEIGGVPLAFRPVLLGEASFEMSGGRKTIDELGECFALDTAVVPTGFAVLNLDEDALNEVVVRVAIASDDLGFLVLDMQTELVYGYAFYLRTMNELKQDGTFGFSSGAMDSGIGRMTFRGPVAEAIELARCRDGGNGEIVYAVNGVPASQAAYEEAQRMQDAKQDVIWHAFTKAEIDAQFVR